MKKIKLFFWTISFLLVLCIGVVLVAVNLVDPNDYKPRLEQLVQSNTGRQLNLKGDLSLTFYPWIGISTGALELANGEGFGDTPMLIVEQANIKIKLLPLLMKKFEIGTIILNKPKIKLVTLADGSTNWDDLLGSWKITDTNQQEDLSKDDAQDVMGIAGLAVQGVSLVDGEIVWDNRNDGQLITISDLHLSIGEIQPDTPLDVELSARVAGNIMPMPAEINFSSSITIDEKLNLINIDEASVEMTMGAQRYELALALTMDIAQQSIAVPAFALTLDALRLDGLFNVSNVFASPTLSGQLNINTSNLGADFEKMRSQQNIELDQGELKPGELKQGKHRFGKATLKTAFNYLNNRVEINSLTAEMEINGQDTKIDIPFASLNVLWQKLKVPALRIRQDELEINADLIGDALFSGAESVELAGSLKLHIADLPDFFEDNQLDDILPASLIKTVASEMDYALNEGNLLLSRMKTFADETALAGSIMFSNVMADHELVGTVKQNIQNINIGRYLTAWDITDMLVGTGDVNLNLTGIDISAEKPLLNMGGQIEFNLQDGAIRGFDLQAALIKLDNTLNLVTGKQQTQYQTNTRTQFAQLSGAFKGANGRFQTNNIFMQALGLRVKGRGSLDFPDQAIDMKFDVTIVEPVADQGIGLSALGLENLESLSIPLTVSGNLAAPSYGLDVGGLLKQQAKKKAREIKKTVTEKLLKLLGE